MIVIIPLIVFAAFCLCWPVFTEETPAKARKRTEAAQRKAIKRHTRELERESRRHTSIWKRHPIKP